MTTRRQFLKGAAATGIAFCSCGMLDAARAQPKAPRLPVKINGKRVLTVDVHSHCYFREAINLMGDAADKVLPPVKGVPEHFIVIEQRLKEMDAMAIDMEVLSINPFWYGKDRDTAAAIVKMNNEKLAELCASRPERFSAFASLTLQFPDLAVQQLETAIKKQGLRGAAIGASVLGEDFADPKFHPFGPRPKNSAPFSSSIRKARRNSPSVSKAMAGCRIRSAIRSTPPLPCST